MHLLNSRTMSRRTLLRGGGAVLALPLLDAMLPCGLRAEAKARSVSPRRLFLVLRGLAINPDCFFPAATGPDAELPRYLKLLERHRSRMTVFSGMSHLGYPNGHHTEAGFLSGLTPERIQREDDIRPAVSVDQIAAPRLGADTRFASLHFGVIGQPISYTTRGTPMPALSKPEEAFRRLFVDPKAEDLARETRRLDDGGSILDGVREQLKSLERRVGAGDRARLDSMAASVREAEELLRRERDWLRRPKPTVDARVEEFRGGEGWSGGQRLWYRLAALAFATDSTRVITLAIGQGGRSEAPGATIDHHDASHHGQDPKKMEEFAIYEEVEYRLFNGLLDQLSAAREGESDLLDRTIVLCGGNMGNPSSHGTSNLPILVAGGGFKHRLHVAFNRQKNEPLSNLYLRFLHQLGIEAPSFGCSTRVLSELA
jgi:hypothetical protein